MSKSFNIEKVLFSISILLSLLLVSGSSLAERPFPKPRGLVNDFANVIPQSYKQKLASITTELINKTEIPVVVVTMPDIGGADYTDYANRLYEGWGIGKKGEDKGVLIFVTIKERKMRIEVGYGLEGIIPDGLAGEIRDRYMIPYLKENKFGEGLLNGTVAVSQIIAKDAGVKLTGQIPVRVPKKEKVSPHLFSSVADLFLSRVWRKAQRVLAIFPSPAHGRRWPQVWQRWIRGQFRRLWWRFWRVRRRDEWRWRRRRRVLKSETNPKHEFPNIENNHKWEISNLMRLGHLDFGNLKIFLDFDLPAVQDFGRRVFGIRILWVSISGPIL